VKTRNRISERAKNVLIVLLFISAVISGWASRLFGNSQARPIEALWALYEKITAPSVGGAAAERFAEAAKPWTVLVTKGEGERYAVRYDTKERDTLYGRTSGLFGEALGSAGIPAKITRERWREALREEGIYYEYSLPVRLYTLGGWFGARVEGEWGRLTVRRLAVTGGDGAGALLFQDAASGEYYEARTAELSSLPSVTRLYSGNGAAFGYERGLFGDEDALILPGANLHPLLEVSAPLENEDNVVSVLNALGVSEHLKYSYIDRDGARVYVEQSATISVSPGGLVRYRADERGDETAQVRATEAEAIEIAREMVAKTIGVHCGEAEAALAGARELTGGAWEVTFVYTIAGGRIDAAGGVPAARVTVTGAEITEMNLYFRAYRTSTLTVELLPEAQAAAAAGGMCRLVYVDDGDATIEPVWMVWREGEA